MNSRLRIVCVYTKQNPDSVRVANRCVKSGKQNGYNVELFPSIYAPNIDKARDKYGLKYMHEVAMSKHEFTPDKAPAPRVANGLTHYRLYKWSINNNRPICIVEHDALFVGKLPKPINDGIIQISSHTNKQLKMKGWKQCNRAQKMANLYPDRKIIHNDGSPGVHRHPLHSLNGTSGYIVGPVAAQRLVEAIERDGITYADRVTVECIGENLYVQVPQSVICDHDVKSCANF